VFSVCHLIPLRERAEQRRISVGVPTTTVSVTLILFVLRAIKSEVSM
jgi:hypothetical protein